MLKILFFILVLIALGECETCPPGFAFIDGDCYKAYPYVNTTWTHAQELCQKDNAFLAIIKSCSLLGDLAVFFHITGLESPSGYWIGASDSATEGEWLWMDGTKVLLGVPYWGMEGLNWTIEPSGEDLENCAKLSPTDQYRFHDENCERPGNPLCQANPLETGNQKLDTGNWDPVESFDEYYRNDNENINETDVEYCNDGFEWVNGTCFFILSEHPAKLSWREAREFCQQNMSSDLPIITDCVLFGILVSFINDNHPLSKGESYWLGATDVGDEGNWYWVDYTPVRLGPPFWGSVNGTPEPSGGTTQNCAILYKDDYYYFHDGQCDEPSHVMCQRDPP